MLLCCLKIDIEVVSQEVGLGLQEEGVEAPGGEEGGDGGQGEGGQAGVGYTPHHWCQAIPRAKQQPFAKSVRYIQSRAVRPKLCNTNQLDINKCN